MPLSLWLKQLLVTCGQQGRDRARTRRQNDEIELSLMRLEERRVLNASGLELAAAAPADSGGTGDGGAQIAGASAESTGGEEVDIWGGARLYRGTGEDADAILLDTGTPEGTVQLSGSITSLTINGSDGDDTLTVDFSNGNPLPTGGLTFNGGAQATAAGDALIVANAETTPFATIQYDAMAAGSGTLTLTPSDDQQADSSIAFSGLEPVTFDDTTIVGTVIVTIDNGTNDPNTAPIIVNVSDAGAGQTSIEFPSAPLENITFANPTNELIILGDDGDQDVVHIQSLADGYASVTIDGRGGDDTTNVNSNLELGTTVLTRNLTIESESIDLNSASITTSGDQLYTGAVMLGVDVTLDASNVTFNGTVDSAGLVSHWTGDNSPEDSADGNEGALQGNAGYNPNGKYGSAFQFNAQGDYVSVPDNQATSTASLDLTDSGTISAWIYPTANSSQSIVVNKEWSYEVGRSSDGTIRWAFQQVSPTIPSWQWTVTDYAAPLNEWTFVAITYDYDATTDIATVKTYDESGVVVHTGTSPGPLAVNDADLRIGDRTVPFAPAAFTGSIDDVRIYNQALDGTEIGQIAANQHIQPHSLTVNTSGTGTTTFAGAVGNIAPLLNLTTNADGSTDLNGGSVTTVGDQNYHDLVVLTDNTTLEGSNLTFKQTLNGDGQGPWTLVANTTGSGLTTFEDAVGNTNALQSLTTNADGTTRINTDLVSGAVLEFNDAVELAASTTLTGTTSVTFNGTVEGNGYDLTVGSPLTTFGDEAADAVTGIGTLTTDADGATVINADTLSGVLLEFNDAVELAASTTLTGTTSVTFNGTVEGNGYDLTVDSPLTKFGDAAADAVTGIGTLTTDAAGTTVIRTAVVNGAILTFMDNVTLAVDTTLTGTTSIRFAGPVTSQANDLVLVSDGSVSQAADAGIGVSNLTLKGKANFELDSPGNDFDATAADTQGAIIVVDKDDLTVGIIGGVTGISNSGGGDVNLTAGTILTVGEEIDNSGGGDTTLEATNGDLVLNAGLANLGGDGRIVGRAGGDVLVQNGTLIQTDTGFIQATPANAGSIDPIVTLTPVPVGEGGANVDALGNASVDVTIEAPSGRNFEIFVDWGDGTVNRFLLPQGAPFDGTQVYRFTHTYTAPPDPINPADPIPVSATVAFDGRGSQEDNTAYNGIRFFRNSVEYIDTTVSDVLTTSGDGVFSFIIIAKSEVEPVQLRRVRNDMQFGSQGTVATGMNNRFEVQATEQEYGTTSPARLFLRRVDSSGKESDDVALDISLLEDGLLEALSRLPNGRYRVYYQEQNSERIRMVREVEVYQGHVVPPGFRSDVSERQPGSTSDPEPKGQPNDATDAEQPSDASTDDSPTTTNPPAVEAPADTRASSAAQTNTGRRAALGTAPAAIGLMEFGSGQRWSEQIDRAYATGRRSRHNATRRIRRLDRDRAE